MPWFDEPDEPQGRFRQSYNAAYGYAQQSPTLWGAIITLIYCISAGFSGKETWGTVAPAGFTALMFILHNIHARRTRAQVSDALDEIKTARAHIETTRNELSLNTNQTVSAAASAAQAVASVARLEELTKKLNDKLDALQKQGK